jgi:hypothetical protein
MGPPPLVVKPTVLKAGPVRWITPLVRWTDPAAEL